MKYLLPILCLFSFIFSDTIKYHWKLCSTCKEKDRVLKNVFITKIDEKGVHYTKDWKSLGVQSGIIKCSDVYELRDNNNNVLPCSKYIGQYQENPSNEELDLIENYLKKSGYHLELGGKLLLSSTLMSLIPLFIDLDDDIASTIYLTNLFLVVFGYMNIIKSGQELNENN